MAIEIIDGQEHKRCRYCNELKPISHFTKSTKNYDGYIFKCRECRTKYNQDKYGHTPLKELEKKLEEKRNATEKICTECGELKPVSEFAKSGDKRRKQPYRSKCKKCVSKYHKQYYKKNIELEHIKDKEYRELNKEKIKNKNKTYKKNNRDKYKKWSKAANNRKVMVCGTTFNINNAPMEMRDALEGLIELRNKTKFIEEIKNG